LIQNSEIYKLVRIINHASYAQGTTTNTETQNGSEENTEIMEVLKDAGATK